VGPSNLDVYLETKGGGLGWRFRLAIFCAGMACLGV